MKISEMLPYTSDNSEGLYWSEVSFRMILIDLSSCGCSMDIGLNEFDMYPTLLWQ